MLETVGLDAEVARAAAPWAAAADAALGRVMRVERGLVSALTEEGPCRASIGGALLSRVALDPTGAPCAGDWCLLRAWPDGRSTLEHILPRRTALVRGLAGEQSRGQVVCSNMDIVAVVVAPHPLPVTNELERLVALARGTGAHPLVVLSECDPATDFAADIDAVRLAVEVTKLSVRTGEGVQALRDRLEGRLTLALLGASGDGRSSLRNALVGADVLGTRVIRQDDRGRRTSVRPELVPLLSGGAIIDTDGDVHSGPCPTTPPRRPGAGSGCRRSTGRHGGSWSVG